MADVNTTHTSYRVAPEKDREGNYYYISPNPTASDEQIPVEYVVITDDRGVIQVDTNPLHMFPMDNTNPDLQWGECNQNRHLYFIPPSEDKQYYKASDFAVLAIPSYAYDDDGYYKCSGYMTDNEAHMTTVRTVCDGTTIECFLDLKLTDKVLKFNTQQAPNIWDICDKTVPTFNPQVDHSKLTDLPPPVTPQYYGLKTQNTREVFSGVISNTVLPTGSCTECSYNSSFQLGTTLYWNRTTQTWSLT